MVFHIIFGGDFVANATGHGYGTQSGGTDERIDFLLAEKVEDCLLYTSDAADEL